MNQLAKRIVGFLLTCVFILLSMKMTMPFYLNAVSSKDWSTVEGEVLKSRVNPNAGKKNNLYQLHFDYQYIIDGTTYHGKGRYFGLGEPSQSWKGELYDFARAHPVGSSVEVYYNPDSPEDCTILTGLSFLGWLLIGLNVLFLFMGVHLMVFPEEWRTYHR